MNITRNVILDLLPLYLADELSDDSRALVEAFLATDPALAALTKQASQTPSLESISIPLTKDNEMKSFERTKRLLFQKNLFLALAIFISLSLLAFRIDETGITWLWQGARGMVWGLFIAAALLWVAFASITYQLRQE
jgi:hypothetical protein